MLGPPIFGNPPISEVKKLAGLGSTLNESAAMMAEARIRARAEFQKLGAGSLQVRLLPKLEPTSQAGKHREREQTCSVPLLRCRRRSIKPSCAPVLRCPYRDSLPAFPHPRYRPPLARFQRWAPPMSLQAVTAIARLRNRKTAFAGGRGWMTTPCTTPSPNRCPSAGTTEDYLHRAGRTARFGEPGKVPLSSSAVFY